MAERPKKRARRTEDAAASERDHHTASPRSPQRDSKQPEKNRSRRDGDTRQHISKKDEDRRKRSVSPREGNERSRRDRSRSRDRSHRERDRDRDRDRGKDRATNGVRRDRDRSRSRERNSKGLSAATSYQARHLHMSDHPSRQEKPSRRSRSRSPVRNGAGASTRTRSPPRPTRSDQDRNRGRDRDRDKVKNEPVEDKSNIKTAPDVKTETKAAVNGDAMMVDEDEEDVLMKRMMGFNAFNTTQNKKVPGNQIYGVRKEKTTQYRQYMNRQGGFNRPLSPGR